MADSQLAKVLTKQVGPLPLWGWGAVILVGGGIGYVVIKRTNSSNAVQTSTPTPITTDTTGANAAQIPQYSGADTGTQNTNPVLTVPTPTGTAPILPVGYVPIKDGNGNIIGWEPPAPPATNQPIPTSGGGGLMGNPPIGNGGNAVNPLIPYSQTWTGKHYFPVSPGHVFTWQGTQYFITSDLGGVIKGVPNASTSSQAAGKAAVTLYAPSSFYH
jgi:hypothetical protein